MNSENIIVPHHWSKDGETCLICGAKDWMNITLCRGEYPGPGEPLTIPKSQIDEILETGK